MHELKRLFTQQKKNYEKWIFRRNLNAALDPPERLTVTNMDAKQEETIIVNY